MKTLSKFICYLLYITVLTACVSLKTPSEGKAKGKTEIKGLTPTPGNPSPSVLKATGDALTPGIPSSRSNGAGSRENAENIANQAITMANSTIRSGFLSVDSLSAYDLVQGMNDNLIYEVEMSEAILRVTSSEKIKNYARMILEDHRISTENLRKIIDKDTVKRGRSVLVPLKLSTENGNSDFRYIEAMVTSHQQSIKLLSAAGKSKDTSVSSFSAKYLPVVRRHLSKAQEITAEVARK